MTDPFMDVGGLIKPVYNDATMFSDLSNNSSEFNVIITDRNFVVNYKNMIQVVKNQSSSPTGNISIQNSTFLLTLI